MVPVMVPGTAFQDSSGLYSAKRRASCSGVLTEILLVDDAIRADHEGHDAAECVFGRVGEESEAPCHIAVHYVALFAAGRGRSLGREYSEAVAPERRGIRLVRVIAFGGGFSHEVTERAAPFPRFPLPVETILEAGRAPKALSKEARWFAVVRLTGIFLLHADIGHGRRR